jgi:hypothetical protein
VLSARASSSPFAPLLLAEAGAGHPVGPPPAFRSWDLIHRGVRPWTVNAERSMHPLQRARLVSAWRADAAWLAVAAHIPLLEAVHVTATPHAANRRSRADVGACAGAVKASIDGLRDAGCLVDDDDKHVLSLTFLPTLIGDWDGLVVVVDEAASDG